MVASILAYLTRLLPPSIPLERLPELWKLPVRTFVTQTGIPTGWGWLARLSNGEFASLAGIAILASSSLPSLGAIMILYAKRGDRIYAVICLATIIVVLLAALGATAPGH